MSDGGKAKESGRGQLQEEVPSTGRRVTRRGFLRQAITGGVAATGGFVAGRATSGEPGDTQRHNVDYVLSEYKSDLAESLSAEDVAWVQKVIGDHFELPFQELQSFDTNTKLHGHPKGVVSSIDERMEKNLDYAQ